MSKTQYKAKYKNVGYKIVCVYFYLEKLYIIYSVMFLYILYNYICIYTHVNYIYKYIHNYILIF